MRYAFKNCLIGLPDEFGMVTVSGKCLHSEVGVVLIVRQSGIEKWQNGASLAEAFPELIAADREFLDSGFCEKTWAAQHGVADGEGSETD